MNSFVIKPFLPLSNKVKTNFAKPINADKFELSSFNLL